jgi:hypothetical protein
VAEPYPNIREIFESWTRPKDGEDCCGKKLASWCSPHLSDRLACSLHLDLALRGGGLSKLIRWRLRSDRQGLKGFLFDRKTESGILFPWVVKHCHQQYRKEWCTPCLYDEWCKHVAHKLPLCELDISDATESWEPGDAQILTSPLFLCLKPSAGTIPPRYRAYGKDQCSKKVRRTFERGGVHKKWTAHKGRGMSTSKVVNMGMPWGAAVIRGGWSPNSNTFQKSYFRKTVFLEHDTRNAARTFEYVLRLQETILS